MVQNIQYNDTKNLPIASLLERLHAYFSEVNMRAETDEYEPMFKFRSLSLIGEIYEFVRVYFSKRSDRLSDYFKGMTLKQCLQTVVSIEELQDELGDIRYELECIDESIPVVPIYTSEQEVYDEEWKKESYADIRCLHDKGIDALAEMLEEGVTPSVSKSILWKAGQEEKGKYKFNKVFAKAKEVLDETEDKPNPLLSEEDRLTLEKARQDHQLGNHSAYSVNIKHDYPLTDIPKKDSFKFLDYIIDAQYKAESAQAEDIYAELNKSLEMLRNVFMTEAEDIYYIRTGNFENLKATLPEDVIKRYYTEIPFQGYKEERYNFERDFASELEEDRNDWRIERGYISRRLTTKEEIEFYNERRTSVLKEMKAYHDLWVLRLHSGSLDTVVTPDNFARMFYRRENIDQSFITLEWQLEIVEREIARLEKKSITDKATVTLNPEQKAVSDFVGNIIQLANLLHEKWDGKEVSPGVHQPMVTVNILNLELIAFLQVQQKDKFEELSTLCYPPTANSNREFCNYVNQLKAKYFVNLPNKYIAEDLGPIIGIKIGTATNYLSQS